MTHTQCISNASRICICSTLNSSHRFAKDNNLATLYFQVYCYALHCTYTINFNKRHTWDNALSWWPTYILQVLQLVSLMAFIGLLHLLNTTENLKFGNDYWSLTQWFEGNFKCVIRAKFSYWFLSYLLWDYLQQNVTGLYWRYVNNAPGNILVLSGNKPLPEAILITICVSIYGITRPQGQSGKSYCYSQHIRLIITINI